MMSGREEAVQRVQDYGHVFGSPAGKRVLEDLKKFCYYHRTTYVPGDPHATSKNEGSREVVLKIMRITEMALVADFNEGAINNMLEGE